MGVGGAAPRERGGRGSRPFLGSSAGVAVRAISPPSGPEGPDDGGTCAQAFGRPGLPVPSAAPGRSARIGRRRPDRPGPCGSETGRGRRPTR